MDGALLGVPPQQATRTVYEFPVPDSLKGELVNESIGLIKLQGQNEVDATNSCNGDSVRLAFELVKQSLYKVDGRLINRGEMEQETIWNKVDPQLRQLILAAYAKLHTPDEDVTANFLKSMKVTVG